jgi:hypothetical protein
MENTIDQLTKHLIGAAKGALHSNRRGFIARLAGIATVAFASLAVRPKLFAAPCYGAGMCLAMQALMCEQRYCTLQPEQHFTGFTHCNYCNDEVCSWPSPGPCIYWYSMTLAWYDPPNTETECFCPLFDQEYEPQYNVGCTIDCP